jgi:alpha-tubulin suppressor-like RCC1 family protein
MPTFYNFTDNSENLVSYSTYNASTWINNFPAGATLTTGISAPDGSNNAVRFTCNNTTNALLRVNIPSFTPNGTDTYTTSFFVRRISGTGSALTDLADGNPSVDYSSQLITNQWVRITVSAVPTATAKTFIDLFSDQNTNYTLDFWGVQIEKKSSAGAYVATNGTIVPGGDGRVYSFDDVFVPADAFRQGNLFTWGWHGYGQLGNNAAISRSTPVTTFAGGTNWKQVSGGGRFTAAIKTDGTLWTWGQNFLGELGNNQTTRVCTPITTFAGGTNWKQVSCGYFFAAAIKTDGTLWTWGYNAYGQLGNNQAGFFSICTPVTTFAGGTNWKQVSCGYNCCAAIKTDGTLWTWGGNADGRLGDNTTINRCTPVTTFAGGTNWKQVSGISGTQAAIKTDGTLWTWGYNGSGELGVNDNTPLRRSTPVTTFAGGTNWKQVSCGDSRILAIKTDGTLWTWGNPASGLLGNNDISNYQYTPITTFAGGTNWKQVSMGRNNSSAIKTDGTLWVWGYNGDGGVGDNTAISRSTPVTTFAGGTDWKQVSAGAGHVLAITYIDNYV